MASFRALPRAFYRRAPEQVARDLLGRFLVRELGGERLALRLVETEAYLGAGDRAAHTYGGRRTARVASMYKGGGHAYVYFTYGMHFCLNVVVGAVDSGQAVLLRGGVPVAGEATMRRQRGLGAGAKTAAIALGPARLCQALGVDRRLDGVPLWRGELRLVEGDPASVAAVETTPRIGVASAGAAASWPLRFVAAD
jgi:DNA-3-methyladenine glycosylase